MKMQDLVPTLDTCRALMEAGFPQDTALAWCREPGGGEVVREPHRHSGKPLCAAPTLAEVLGELPDSVANGNRGYKSRSLIIRGGRIGYEPKSKPFLDYSHPFTFGPISAEAAARLWLALVEAGHVTPRTGEVAR